MKKSNLYFNPTPETLEELKKQYKQLALKFHPDSPSGDTEAMKEINSLYDKLFEKLKNIRANSKGEKYEKQTAETPEMFKDIISKIINLEGIHIEIIGTFIWLTGNTRQYKDIFKDLGFKWHNGKTAWYLAPEDYRKRGKNIYTLEEIRSMFGYQDIENEKNKTKEKARKLSVAT